MLVLGLDGPGRHAVPQLAGLGIGRLTLLDRDVPTARRVLEHDPQVEVAVIRYEPPQYAGRPVLVDFAGGCALTPVPEWPRDPACPVCGPDGTTAGGR